MTGPPLSAEALDALTGTGTPVVLRLVPVADPLTRHGHPPRAVDTRLRLALKVLLRSYGLKCEAVRDEPRTDGE